MASWATPKVAQMTEDNPTGSDGRGGKNPSAEQLNIAAAINSFEAKYETAQKGRPEHDRQALLWTKRTAKGVFIYTALTVGITAAAIWSSWNAQRAVDLSARNFIVDQRPYIWLTNNLGSPQVWNKRTDGKVQITWAFHYTNYGKTPANNVTVESFIRLGNGEFKHGEGYVGRQNGEPIPPNKDDFSEIPSWPISPDEANQYAAMDSGISIAGIFTYEDAPGNRYETDFCIGRLQLGGISYQPPTEHCDNQIK
jgi:hypothetical protein